MSAVNGRGVASEHHVDVEADMTPTNASLLHPTENVPQLEENKSLMFLCFDLSLLSPLYRFWLLTAGLFFFFMANSYVEEYTFKRLPKFEFGWYLTLFELVSFVVFGCLDRQLNTFEPLLSRNAPVVRTRHRRYRHVRRARTDERFFAISQLSDADHLQVNEAHHRHDRIILHTRQDLPVVRVRQRVAARCIRIALQSRRR